MADVTPDTPKERPDLVDRALGALDHGLDVVHDKVLRPIIVAGRAVAYGLVILLAAVVLVAVVVIGLVRLLDVYAFGGRDWLSYAVVGAVSLLIGLVIWRRRRPVGSRKT